MRDLFLYSCYLFFNLIVILVSFFYLVKFFILGDIFFVSVMSFCLFTDLNYVINRHSNFVKYFPHFKEKWLHYF